MLGKLMTSITADTRHCGLRIVVAEQTASREYGRWSMGYVEGFGAGERVERLLSGDEDSEDDVRSFARRLFEAPRL